MLFSEKLCLLRMNRGVIQKLFGLSAGCSDKTFGEVQIDESYKDINFLFFRYVLNNKPVFRMECQIIGNKIHINHIKPFSENKRNKYFNKGYGSKLMNALLDYCEEKGIFEIYGELSIVDLDYKDRIHHFYQKFGFNITTFPELNGCYYGSISKKL